MPTAAFYRRGVTRFFFCPTITKAAPTVAQVTAGTELVDLADVAGFTFTNQPITTPTMDSTFDSSIPGPDTSDESSVTWYEPKTGTDTNVATLAKGTAGYIVIFYRGTAGASPAIGDKCEVWPIVSAGPNRQYTMGAEAAKMMATLTPSATPNINATLV
jgi:hypothetical protein